MTGSDDEAWRPACGACGTTSLAPSSGGYRCATCGAPWDGSEAPEPARELDLPVTTTTLSACEKGIP